MAQVLGAGRAGIGDLHARQTGGAAAVPEGFLRGDGVVQEAVEEVQPLADRLVNADELLGVVVDVAAVVGIGVNVLTRARVRQRHLGAVGGVDVLEVRGGGGGDGGDLRGARG